MGVGALGRGGDKAGGPRPPIPPPPVAVRATRICRAIFLGGPYVPFVTYTTPHTPLFEVAKIKVTVHTFISTATFVLNEL